MALFDTHTPLTKGRQSLRPSGLFGQFVGMMSAWNDARVTRNTLENLSDHELNDIGLTRGDIDRVSRPRY